MIINVEFPISEVWDILWLRVKEQLPKAKLLRTDFNYTTYAEGEPTALSITVEV